MTLGVVLEGGAKRGIYTAGVLDVLYENSLLPAGVIGVSAGAIHGCSFVSGQVGRSIRYNLNYGKDYRFMSFKSWLKTGNVVDTDFCYHELPEKLDVFDNEAFKRSSIKFYVTCSNVETGRAEYFLCHDLFREIDLLRASATLPFAGQIVETCGKKLLDGGITDSIPLKASQKLGFDKNLVVLTRPAGYRKKSSWLGKMLAPIVYRKYPLFVKAMLERPHMYNQQLADIEKEEKKGNTFVLRPSRTIRIKRMEQNLDIVKEMYELGRFDAQSNLAALKEFFA